MIESEHSRQRITEDITRWCDYVKATPLLRQGDIEALVGSILGGFYHVTLCCGHMVRSSDEGVDLEFYEYDNESRGVVSGSYCKDCVEEYIRTLGAWEVKGGN